MNPRFPLNGIALGLAVLLPASSALADPTFRMDNRTELLNFSVSGPGAAQSFYDTKARIYHESDLSVSGFKFGIWDGTLSSTVRYTDSTQYDPDYWSLQKMEVQLKDAKTRIDLGDLFANLSPYSMMKGIKGAGVQHNLSDDRNYIRAAYGSFDGQWAYLLRSARPDEPMDRHGGGIRLQRSDGILTWGANLARVTDQGTDPRRGTSSVYAQFLPALDWEYRSAGMVVSGEHAYSGTDVTAPAGTVDHRQGTANRLNFRGAFRTVSVDANVEQVTPNFLTLGGGATTDRQRLFTRADWRMDRVWRFFGSYDYYHNSLDRQLATRTYNEIYEAGVTRSRLLDRKAASLTVSARSRFLWTDDASSTSHSDRIRLKYRDRFLNDALDFGAEYERMLNMDQRGTALTHLGNNLYNLSFGYRGEINKAWGLRTNLDLGKSEVQNSTTAGYDVMDTARLSVVASHPDSTEIGASYDLGNNSITVVNSSSRQNRAMVYWSQRPPLLNGGSVRAEGSINDYQFDDLTRNYREQLLRLVVNWNLEKKPTK